MLPLVDSPRLSPGTSRDTTNAETNLRKLRTVVIDDNEDARELLAELLRRKGHEVFTAGDAFSGLAALKEHAPDVALIDLGLPNLDGIALVKRLRSEAPELSTRLVAVTGFGQDSDRVRTEDAGFHAHLVKPVSIAMISAVLGGDSENE